MKHGLPILRHAAVFLPLYPVLFLGAAPLAQESESPETSSEEQAEEAAQILPDGWEEVLEWRSIGPANMSGRITDITVHPTDASTWWGATAGAGLVKTVNGGTTFEHQFTHEAVGSVGALTVSPSEPDTLWLGTGEGNPRNSVSWGNGVYKSTDGGDSWTHVGLEDSFQIGDIVVHPSDPNVVYVGALGRLWGPSPERGLFRTSDGGETWEQLLFVDDLTGVIDIEMHPEDPDVLLVATYERERDEFCTNDPAKKWGAGSGLWRTTDGGATFEKVSEGLPTGTLGRIGLDWYVKDPSVVYMVLESDRISQEPEDAAWAGIEAENADVGAKITAVEKESPAARAGLQQDDIIVSVDGATVHSYSDLLGEMRSHLAGETVAMLISRERKGVELEITFERRPEAEEDSEQSSETTEREPRKPFSAYLGGQRENVQRQQGPDGHEYGGIYRSEDGGLTWTRINSLNPRPMYYSEIRVDPYDEDHVFVLGTSLHRSKDGGLTFTNDGGSGGVHVDHHAMWIDPEDGRHIILGNDGGIYETRDRMENWEHHNKFAIGQFYHVTTDSELDYKVYGGLQDNGTWGGPVRAADGSGTGNGDWLSVGGGDGFICRVDAEDPDQIYYESQNGGMGARNLRTGARSFLRPRAPRGETYRWNWRTPFLLSSFNSRIWYSAGNHVFRSLDRGADAQAISPDITRTERGSATALAESPRSSDELWVGTDDGALWSTKDGGANWTNHFEDRVLPEEGSAEDVGAVAAATTGEAEVTDEAKTISASQSEQPKARTAAAQEDDLVTSKGDFKASGGDLWNGTWKGRIEGASLAGGGTSVYVRLTRGEGGVPTGRFASDFGEGDLRGIAHDAEAGTLSFRVADKDAEIAFDGTLSPEAMAGTVTLAGGLVEGTLHAAPADGEEAASPAKDSAETTTETAPAVVEATSEGIGTATTLEASTPRRRQEGGRRGEGRRGEGRRGGQDEASSGEEVAPTGEPLSDLMPDPHRVSEIVCSRHDDDVTYVAFDGHRTDDDRPFLVVTHDGGASWKSLTENLPDGAGAVRTVEEDRVNKNLIWIGTEFGVYISLDRGEHWQHMNGNLPTVAVHALAQHPSLGDVVAGTHGRSLWILDATVLRQMTPEALAEAATLFAPTDVVQWRTESRRGQDGLQAFEGEVPGRGVRVAYHLGKEARSVQLSILDEAGATVKEIEAGREVGLHHGDWDLRMPPPESAQGWRRRWGRPAPAGTYTVELSVDGTTHRRTFEVQLDPSDPSGAYLEHEWQALEVESLHQEEEHEAGEPELTSGRF